MATTPSKSARGRSIRERGTKEAVDPVRELLRESSFSKNPVVLVGNFDTVHLDATVTLLVARVVVDHCHETPNVYEVVITGAVPEYARYLRRGARVMAVCHWEAFYESEYGSVGRQAYLVADVFGPDWSTALRMSDYLNPDLWPHHDLRTDEVTAGLELGPARNPGLIGASVVRTADKGLAWAPWSDKEEADDEPQT